MASTQVSFPGAEQSREGGDLEGTEEGMPPIYSHLERQGSNSVVYIADSLNPLPSWLYSSREEQGFVQTGSGAGLESGAVVGEI